MLVACHCAASHSQAYFPQKAIHPLSQKSLKNEANGLLADPFSVKSGSKLGKSTSLTEITNIMRALPGFVSSNLSLLGSPDLTEKGDMNLQSSEQSVAER